MLVEAATARFLVFRRPEEVPPWAALAGLVVPIWASTALVQVPRHKALGSGFDRRAHSGLVATNRARTAAWSARSALVLRMAALG